MRKRTQIADMAYNRFYWRLVDDYNPWFCDRIYDEAFEICFKVALGDYLEQRP